MPGQPRITKYRPKRKSSGIIDTNFRYESDFQKKAATFMARHFPRPETVWWHTANERRTDKARGASLKAQGVLPGVADLVVLNWKCGIELKIKKRNPTEPQNDFRKMLEGIGWKYYLCGTWDEFLAAVMDASGCDQAELDAKLKENIQRRYCG